MGSQSYKDQNLAWLVLVALDAPASPIRPMTSNPESAKGSGT